MTQYKKKRAEASRALIDLRMKMGKTQQTFAVEVLKTAIGTIARYETSDAPRGELLLRLRDIAHKQGLHDLENKFDFLYLQAAQKAIGHHMMMASGYGFVITPLYGKKALDAAWDFFRRLDEIDDERTGRPDSGTRLIKNTHASQKVREYLRSLPK